MSKRHRRMITPLPGDAIRAPHVVLYTGSYSLTSRFLSDLEYTKDREDVKSHITRLVMHDGPVCPLLNLPVEVRVQILDLVIPELRLAPFPYFDPEWDQVSSTADNPYQRTIPDLVYSCRQLYDETTNLLYQRATLEIAPPQQTNNFLLIHLKEDIISDSFIRLTHTFRIYNPALLKLIHKAHVFSNHSNVINGECYESTLKWLVAFTSVDTIELSQRIMTRIRGTNSFDLTRWSAAFSATMLDQLRLVRIWTKSNRRPWEYEKIQRLIARAGEGSLKPVQVYFIRHSGGTNFLQLDPRWLVTHHDDPSAVHEAAIAATEIDFLMHKLLLGRELEDYKSGSRHVCDDYWIYQILVVSSVDQPSKPMSQT